MLTELWLENLKGRNCFGDLGVCGRIVLSGIETKYDMAMWT
jgi:hypothetical protein